MSKKKTAKTQFKPAFILIYSIFIIMFFVFLELLLRVSNYGLNFSPFIKHKTLEKYYATNVYYANKYYAPDRTVMEYQGKNLFLREKPKGTLRGFVVGGSTAEGFPYFSNNSFSKIIEKSLNYAQDKYNFEILNFSFSAMSSYYVADAMKNLKKYEPDFFIIYSGHNEYYGSISVTTSSSHFARKAYIFLRNFKTVQFIQKLFTKEKKMLDKNLMATQFNEKKLEKDDKFDNYVAECFIKNIEESVKLYSNKNIPVFLVNPVSNFIDMPPFISKDEDKYKDIIIEYNNEIEKGDINSIVALENKIDKELFEKNADMKYLKAKRDKKLKGFIDLDKYIEAKDLDLIPFRARSNINSALEKFSKENRYKNFYYIDLLKIMKTDYDNSIFNNTIFIDHLHFNKNGQKLIANIVAKELSNYYNINDKILENRINDFYNDEKLLEKSINYFAPYTDIATFMSIHELLMQSPFKDMKIKYEENYPPLNEITKDRNLFDKLTTNNAFNILSTKYESEGDTDSLIKMLLSYLSCNLLDWKPCYNLSIIYTFLEKYELAEYYLIYGYLVSNKSKEMNDAVINFYNKMNNNEKIEVVKKLRDFPEKPQEIKDIVF